MNNHRKSKVGWAEAGPPKPPVFNLLPAALALCLAGCMVGPDYHRPPTPMQTQFKELNGWTQAIPADTKPRGDWWTVFGDPTLNKLEQRAMTANQTIAAQAATYDQARALVDEARASLFPILGATVGATRSGAGHTAASQVSAEATASWELDVWGAIRRQVQSAKATAQQDQALLANARLSAGASLATAYMEMAISDALQRLLNDTVVNDQRSLNITHNQYAAGFAARSDVILAQTQLESAQSSAESVGIARGQYEHAIAVLAGMPPADLSMPPLPAPPIVPAIPVSVPSTLLQRRPDIAAAERAMASSNELIGVAVAAYYPTINLSGLFGFQSGGFGSLFSAGNEIWSAGGTIADDIFAGGARTAAVEAARAQYNNTVATYRQTVLSALQQVEDQLVALRQLQLQAIVEDAAVRDSTQAVAITLNEYRAGTQPYTAVITAQNTQLAAQQSALSIRQSQLTAAVTLITALGGGWKQGSASF